LKSFFWNKRNVSFEFNHPKNNTMLNLVRTDSKNPDFLKMVKELDQTLKVTDGDDHAFYNQFNALDRIKNVIVAYDSGIPVACGAFREYGPRSVEIKRMYTKPLYRKRGYASAILEALENWAIEIGYNKCVLETGIFQPPAIALYKKRQYDVIPNYGQYSGVGGSMCFLKYLAAS